MSTPESWAVRRARLLDRFHARAARFGRASNAFTSQPEPRTIGSYGRGRQLCDGNFLFAGYHVVAKDTAIWDLAMPDEAFETEAHGFLWLDDLAAAGDALARAKAQEWTHAWIKRHGRGSGPGWAPDLTGRRLMRWINHAILLLNGQEREASRAFFRTLSAQTTFLARRWHTAEPGLPRFEALCGLIYASLSLAKMDRHVGPASEALARECAERIDGQGGIPTRNPEELLEVFTLLTWCMDALVEAGMPLSPEHQAAIERIAPTLRSLRHADGGLARFHGGGRGIEGRLDQALATSGVKQMRHTGLSMGFVRLAHGRTSVIVDAAPPPSGEQSLNAHASTLAFELTSGRRPLIVNCGSGASFGANWRRAGRATPSHSTLALEGYSSSRLGGSGFIAGRRTELLLETPQDVVCNRPEEGPTAVAVLSHDGFEPTHGLTHVRRLELATDGRGLVGDDSLSAVTRVNERQLALALDQSPGTGIRFHIRFHLHPDVRADLDMGGTAVSMMLKSEEVWIFRFTGPAQLSLGPSVFLEKGRMAPRASKQIVLTGDAHEVATHIGWTLSKAQDTPSGIRDTALEEDLAADRT
ncbi:MAG: heparinase II/III family protein [Pseudomonadota bacterium]